MMGPVETEFPKWQEWARRIKQDVESRLVNPRQVFRAFARVLNENSEHITEHEGEVFCNFIKRCYVSHAAMAIRSHVKRNRDSISIGRLLDEIRESASQFTFQFYLQQFPKDPSYVDWQTPTFRQFSKNGKTISQDILQQDVEQLETLTRKVEQLADRSFAHLDKRGFGDMVTF